MAIDVQEKSVNLGPAMLTVAAMFFIAGMGFFLRANSKLTEVVTILKAIQLELGNHETGLRGVVHRHTRDLLLLDGRMKVLEERLSK